MSLLDRPHNTRGAAARASLPGLPAGLDGAGVAALYYADAPA